MDNLEFKDFSTGGAMGNFFAPDQQQHPPPPPDPSKSASSLSGNLLDNSDSAESQQQKDATKPHFLSLHYYQRFFDIDEEQVFTRLLNSFIPRRTGNFIADFVQPNPDLWGPFWTCVTLVFSIAIVGNFARFLKTYGLDADLEYTSDFSFVTGATSLVFGYVLLLPSLVYCFLWYHRPPSSLPYSFFDLLCAFGYSLTAFVPVSVLWLLFPFPLARWALIIVPVVLTGSVLVLALWPTVRDHPNRLTALGFVAAICVAHALLALCLKEFFLDEAIAGPSSPAAFPTEAPAPIPTTGGGHNNGTATTVAASG